MIARRALTTGLLLSALARPSWAFAATGPEDLRTELDAALPRHRLIGKGRLTVFGLQVYDARLWALPGFKPENLAEEPFALELAYLRDFKSKDIAERSLKEIRRSAAIDQDQAKVWTNELMRVIPDVRKGDRVMGIHRPGAGAQMLVNGKPSGDLRDIEFTRLFFGIWLSPKTSAPNVRAALLAGAR